MQNQAHLAFRLMRHLELLAGAVKGKIGRVKMLAICLRRAVIKHQNDEGELWKMNRLLRK